MKDGNFEKGDKLECVDDSDRPKLKKGGIYTYTESMIRDSTYMYVEEYGNCNLRKSRFKLAEPEFTPKYFSTLNEKDAEPFIGKIMEFADHTAVRNKRWFKCIYTGLYKGLNPFESKISTWQFMRTCPETFQKKMVTKLIECWINMYLDQPAKMHDTRETADAYAGSNRIDCVYVCKEYEVEHAI